MQSNKELFEQLEGFDTDAKKAVMAGLPAPNLELVEEFFNKPYEGAEQVEKAKQELKAQSIPKLNRRQRRAAAKKAMKQAKSPEPTVYYICDPSKNIQCAKTNCHLYGGPCKCTRNIKYAKQPVEKAQMIIPVSGEERRDLMKQYAKELKGE